MQQKQMLYQIQRRLQYKQKINYKFYKVILNIYK